MIQVKRRQYSYQAKKHSSGILKTILNKSQTICFFNHLLRNMLRQYDEMF
jgi:hypothetical protein